MAHCVYLPLRINNNDKIDIISTTVSNFKLFNCFCYLLISIPLICTFELEMSGGSIPMNPNRLGETIRFVRILIEAKENVKSFSPGFFAERDKLQKKKKEENQDGKKENSNRNFEIDSLGVCVNECLCVCMYVNVRVGVGKGKTKKFSAETKNSTTHGYLSERDRGKLTPKGCINTALNEWVDQV